MGVHYLQRRGQSRVRDGGNGAAGVVASAQSAPGLCGRREGARASGRRVGAGASANRRAGEALRKLRSHDLAQAVPGRLLHGPPARPGPTWPRGLWPLTLQREEQQRRQRGAPRSHAGAAGSAPAARSAPSSRRRRRVPGSRRSGKPGPPRLAAGSQTAPRGGDRRARGLGKCSSRAAPLRGG